VTYRRSSQILRSLRYQPHQYYDDVLLTTSQPPPFRPTKEKKTLYRYHFEVFSGYRFEQYRS